MFDYIIIRYGELSLKGKNRHQFIQRLYELTKQKLAAFPQVQLQKAFDRMYVQLNGCDYAAVATRLQEVFGIQTLSIALRVDSDIASIKEGVLQTLQEMPYVKTFKISAKRIDKGFSIPSQELNPLLGGHVLKHYEQLNVDVHQPDVTLRVEVNKSYTFITGIEYPGAGGLPVGTGGKIMMMLSGGIDSPVASYLTLKRGARIEAVHFHSPPYTSERSKQKVIDICQKLTRYTDHVKLHVVPFAKVQESINEHVPDNYSMTIMRRMMLRISEQLAENHGALAVSTGESMGQVASQTLESMNTINEVTNMPVLRPLLAMDKTEIIRLSRQMDTYDISIRPYEDCCTIFVPSAPKTKPDRRHANQFEKHLPVESLATQAVAGTETLYIDQKKPVEDEFTDLF